MEQEVSWLEPISENGYKKCHDMYFEGFIPNGLYDHRSSRIMTQGDRLWQPLYVGDTLYVECKILGRQFAKETPNQGVATIETKELHQEEVEFLIWEPSFLMSCRLSNEVNV